MAVSLRFVARWDVLTSPRFWKVCMLRKDKKKIVKYKNGGNRDSTGPFFVEGKDLGFTNESEFDMSCTMCQVCIMKMKHFVNMTNEKAHIISFE